MTDLSQNYNDCARELHLELTGKTSGSHLPTSIISECLKQIAEAQTPADRQNGFDKIEAFYNSYNRSVILNDAGAGSLPAKADMTKVRVIVTKHLTI